MQTIPGLNAQLAEEQKTELAQELKTELVHEQTITSASLLRSWTTLGRELVADCKVFSVHKLISQRTTGDSSEVHDFFVFKPSNWVNVIPVTADHKVILIEQYRHGIEGLTLEIPGGMIDAEDASSLIAGERELLEETGYRGDELIFLGRNHPNPAIQNNICDTYVSFNVKHVQVPCFDSTEEVAVRLVAIKEIPKLIKTGMITHSLVIVAFHYLQQYCLDTPGMEQYNPFAR